MQIGIDLGASKIESVVLSEDGKEHLREREPTPQSYNETINLIKKIVIEIERKFNKELNVGLCHPGAIIPSTGKHKNANNTLWLNNRTLQKDISKELNKNVYCENDANCLALSEAIDGSAKNYKTVFGVILGSGCGGGLVISKKIISGSATNKNEAIKLLEYLASPKGSKGLAGPTFEHPLKEVNQNSIVRDFGEFIPDKVTVEELGASNSIAIQLMKDAGWD